MLNRMIGSIGNNAIVFNFNPESQTWDAQVPSLPSGEYTVEVVAYDQAGNTAYTATMLFNVDLDSIQMRVIDINYSSEFVELPFGWVVKQREYQTKCCERFNANEIESYQAKLISEVI